jgi:hypothetical protein
VRIRATNAAMWLAIGLVLVSALNYANGNAEWLKPLIRDLGRWFLTPAISGVPPGPVNWPVLTLAVALVGGAGWMGSTVALRGTPLANDAPARLGATIVLGVSLLGYAGTVAVAVGRLESWFLWMLLGVATAATAVALLLRRSPPHESPAGRSTTPTRPLAASGPWQTAAKWIALPTGVGVVIFSFVHAVLAPIAEWDATIYHAALARLWFLGRPDPPLIFGPSVGIEISANYPPLFPAVGATAYTLVGNFDDFYLRLVTPTLAVGLLLVTFAYARLHAVSKSAGWWAVILLLGSPLLVLYMQWATNYVLLTCLTVLVLLFCELAATSGQLTPWIAGGVAAGLAILTNFYGWVTVGFALIAALIWLRSWERIRALAIFGLVASLVAAPWLVRNWVQLGDPVYPLGSPLFHSVGLLQPLWDATKGEIVNNALSQFGGAHGVSLGLLETGVAIASPLVFAVGLAVGLPAGIGRSLLGHDRKSLYLTACGLLLLVAVLAPGWYWLRALLPIVPIAALLAAKVLDDVIHWSQTSQGNRIGTAASSIAAPTFIALALLSSMTSLSLSFAGPNLGVFTENITDSRDLLQGVRDLGSNQKELELAFDGDYACWQWLNSHVGPHDKVATLDIRIYYLDRPENVFYLDGLEAAPLLQLHDPASVRQFLQGQSVRFIMIPAWAIGRTPQRDPAVDVLPIIAMLGVPDGFPLIARFPAGGATAVYGVDSPTAQPIAAVTLRGPNL